MPTHIEFNEKIVKRPIGDIQEIKSIHFGKDVERIKESAFQNFPNLETVTFDPECKITSIEKYTFRDCYKLRSINIPNNVEIIEDRAFSGCKSLKYVVLPNSLETIGDIAFFDCQSLKSITIPNSVKKIGDSAFTACKSLKSITISNSVKKIGYVTFASCENLTEINLPQSTINKLNFSKPNQISEEKLNQFRKFVELPAYCDIKVAGQIIKLDNNAKIQQCKAILKDAECSDQLKTLIRSQLVFSYNNIGNRKRASDELKTLKNIDLVKYPELKKQCLQNCNQDKMVAIAHYGTAIKQKMKAVRESQKTLTEMKEKSLYGIKSIGPKDRQM